MKFYKGTKRLFNTCDTESEESDSQNRYIIVPGIESLDELKFCIIPVFSLNGGVPLEESDNTMVDTTFYIKNDKGEILSNQTIPLPINWVYSRQLYHLFIDDTQTITPFGANIESIFSSLDLGLETTMKFSSDILNLTNSSTSNEIVTAFGSLDEEILFKKSIRDNVPIKITGSYHDYTVLTSEFNDTLAITEGLSVQTFRYVYSITVNKYNPSTNTNSIIILHFVNSYITLEDKFSRVVVQEFPLKQDTITRLTSLESWKSNTNTEINNLKSRVTTLENNPSSGSSSNSINGEFIKYNYSEGEEITDFVSVDLYNKIAPGYTIDYTSTIGTGHSIMILQTRRSVTGTIDTLNMYVCNGTYNNYIGEISFSIDSDYDSNVVFLGANGPYSGGGGEACFTSDTLVLTEMGLKPISEVKVNDKVLSYNKELNKQEFKPVLAVISHTSDKVYTIKTNKSIIMATYDHPIYTVENGLTYTSVLSVGNHLLTNNNTEEEITSIERNNNEYTVYDISVKDNHTYYVGQNSILVYNESVTNLNGGDFNEVL